MSIQIQNARILTPFAQQDGAVLVAGDRILDVSRNMDAPKGTQVIDAKNLYLVPGYIDLHVHLGGGRRVMEGTPEAVTALGNAHAREGTTTLLPTTSSAPMEEIEEAIDAVRAASEMDCEGTIAGVHVQGPFLSTAYMPAVRHGDLLAPEKADWRRLTDRWVEGLRMMGVSPELPGALALGDALRERGVVLSISRSNASYDQVMAAVTHGYSDVTSIYTNCSTLRTQGDIQIPGVTESALVMDELTVQLVADGKRLPLSVLQVVFRCKGAENILLVSDASHAVLKRGEPPQTTMAALVRNMVAAGVSLRVALRMATVNPARRIGLDRTKGRIGAGYDADLLLLDESLNVRFCMAKGRILRNDLESVEQSRAS